MDHGKPLKVKEYVLFGTTIVFLLVFFCFVRDSLISFNDKTYKRTFLLTGDEPAYLLGAYSLAHDGDFNIRNNIIEESWRAFQDRKVCGLYKGSYEYFVMISPAMSKIDTEKWRDKQLLVYRPGVCFILALSAWSESNMRWLAYFFVTLFCLLCLLGIFIVVRDSKISLFWSIFLPLALLLSPPSFFYINQAFPEMPVSVLLAFSAVLLLKPDIFKVFLSAICLSAAVWFTDRALIPAFFLGLACILSAKKKEKIFVILLLSVSAFFLVRYYWMRFGVPYPIHHNQRVSPSILFIIKGLPKIMLDGGRGILMLSPVLIFAPYAFWKWWRSGFKKHLCGLCLLAFLSSLLVVASFPDWMGGICPTGRYGVMFQWLALPAFLVWSKEDMRTREKVFFLVLLSIGLFQSLMLFHHPNWWYREYHPIFAYKWIQPYYDYLPDLQKPDTKEIFKALIWSMIFSSYVFAAVWPLNNRYTKRP